ncbi:hypothetical protein CMO89_01470 [Candidatus Woesearchaeota archaeon]|nr:hypothetical protein [Candidatus Woesearchaeota archaeon]|tara:strand:- start:1499 stop:2299 length:801 start_codon:yes stop_codon:yes gene_type:complete
MSLADNSADRERYVVKIGGSVLTSDDAYAYQARRIIDFYEKTNAERVYIIPSARKGHTDELINNLCKTPGDKQSLDRLLDGDYNVEEDVKRFDNTDIARYLLTGEIESAQRFRKETSRLGVDPQSLLQGVNFPIIADDRYLFASVDLGASEGSGVIDKINNRIVIVPGFGAHNYNKEVVLLGRNSSDFVAALIGHLDPLVKEVIYLKDVGGIYLDGKVKESMTKEEYTKAGIKKVLDPRCLEYLGSYGIRVQHCESEIGEGGTVIT